MRLSESDLSSLIGRIYDAALNAHLWSTFMEGAADALDAGASALLHQDWRDQHDQVAVSIRLDPDLVRQYIEHYASVNPWVVTAGQKGLLHDGCILPGQAIVPEAELKKTEFYSEFLSTFGGVHNLGVNVFLEESRMTNLTFHRAESQSSFGDEEVRFLRLLLPHLKRAMQIHRRISSVDLMVSAAADALDALPHGVLFVTSRGRVVFANRVAREILAMRDGLSIVRGELRAASSEQTASVQRLVGLAASTAAGTGQHPGGVLALERPSMKRSLLVVVAPLKRVTIPGPGENPSAVIFLADPDCKLEPEDSVLQRLYGFTPAESRVAVKLIQGVSVEESADQLDVSLNTARTHVKRLFEKTDTHRHAELLRILLSGVATIRTD